MVGENAVCEKTTAGVESSSDACDGPRSRGYVLTKSIIEWLASLAMLFVLGPIMLLLGLMVKLTSPGPAFYSQVRLGLYGKHYRIFKIRTMAHNCEAKTGAVWSSGANDPRVTKLGRILRDTHLDELPQLWNVLRGEMSLIGPRPERPEIASKLERALPCYRHRLLVKPGVTGLAQVQLPPDLDIESVRRKLAYDLHYVREASPVLDVKILFATGFGFLASAINAIGKSLVKGEKTAVESHNYGDLKIVTTDAWRMGAA